MVLVPLYDSQLKSMPICKCVTVFNDYVDKLDRRRRDKMALPHSFRREPGIGERPLPVGDLYTWQIKEINNAISQLLAVLPYTSH